MIHLFHRPATRRSLLLGLAATALAGNAARAFAQSSAFVPFPELTPLPEIAERTDGPMKVVATTGLIGNMVAEIGGSRVEVSTILPANADPHEFEPAPQDIATAEGASVVFVHGLDLDEWAEDIIENASGDFSIVTVSDGIETVNREEGDDHDDDDNEDDEHDHESDPHIWFDPTKAAQMAANIAAGLIAADPEGTDGYNQRLAAYQQQLTELDQQIAERIATIPEENRKIVTNHDALGYFADRYGLTIVGTVIPGIDASAEPSAQEIAELIETIEREGVRVIFAENTIDPNLAEELASQAGITVVDTLFTDSLGEPGSGADTYIGLMRTDTQAIVEALTAA